MIGAEALSADVTLHLSFYTKDDLYSCYISLILVLLDLLWKCMPRTQVVDAQTVGGYFG